MKYFLIVMAIVAMGCNITVNNNDSIAGNGIIKKESRTITDFKGLDVAGPFEIVLTQGNTYAVEIEADENLLEFIKMNIDDGNLEISESDGYELRSKSTIKIKIQMPVVDEITVSGSGTVKSETIMQNSDEMDLDIAGSGEINLEVKSPKIDVKIGGSGRAELSGSTRELDISIGGSGDCIADDLLSENCKVSIGGSGTARVYASISLRASIGGSGNIYYHGEPKNISKSVGGSGSIEQVK